MNNAQIQPIGLDVVFSADENYAQHLRAALVSCLINCSKADRLRFLILDGGLSESSKRELLSATERFGAKLTFNTEVKSDYTDYPMKSNRLTTPTYYRLSVPDILPDQNKRAVYLDCDLVVEGDLLKLKDIAFNESEGLAAVQDMSRGTAAKRLGIPPQHYFNAGVILLNLSFWRKNRISEKVRQYKLQNSDDLTYEDQCALNAILWNNWKRLPPKWNQQSGLYRKSIQKMLAVHHSMIEIKETLEQPTIIHFIGSQKPWSKACTHPMRRRYHRYRGIIDPKYQPPTLYETLVECTKAGKLRHLVKSSINSKAFSAPNE